MPDHAPLTPQFLFETGAAGYLQELRLLARILGSDFINELLPFFADYEYFLQHDRRQYFSPELVQRLGKGEDTLYTDKTSVIGQRLLDCANLAAACEVFNGWTIDAGALSADNCAQVLAENMRISGSGREQLGKVMAVRLNRGDAVRTAQIIKLLGLLPTDAGCYDQLALGASLGRRDREGFHRISAIGPERPGAEFSSVARLNFAVKSGEPNSVVIVDNDKNLEPDFARINLSENSQVQALNLDLYEGLERLAARISRGHCRPRNLVTMYRLEPRALPDIPQFLDKLDAVVSDDAFYLATIGAGNDFSEFVERQAAFGELMELFRARGLRPLRIILHDQGTQANSLASPAFGISEFASFEMLFCNLASSKVPRDRRLRVSPPDPARKPVSPLNPELWNSFLPSNRRELTRGAITFIQQQGLLKGEAVELLNLGSGVGVTSTCLREIYPAFSITDIDQVPYRRDLMHKRYVQGDVAGLPLRDHSFDAIFSSYTFSYLGCKREVMGEWLRVLRPGGHACFIFHAPHSAYLTTAREVLATNIAKDFFELFVDFPGDGFAGLYDWYCQKNNTWRMVFSDERAFLSYAHEIQVCKHLVEEVASQMFGSTGQIENFFAAFEPSDIMVQVLDEQFNVQPSSYADQAPFLAWFVVLNSAVPRSLEQ